MATFAGKPECISSLWILDKIIDLQVFPALPGANQGPVSLEFILFSAELARPYSLTPGQPSTYISYLTNQVV